VESEPIVVDLSAADDLPESEVRAWASDQRIFISSVMDGMQPERSAVASAVEELGATAGWF
jgi:hypothetical protein